MKNQSNFNHPSQNDELHAITGPGVKNNLRGPTPSASINDSTSSSNNADAKSASPQKHFSGRYRWQKRVVKNPYHSRYKILSTLQQPDSLSFPNLPPEVSAMTLSKGKEPGCVWSISLSPHPQFTKKDTKPKKSDMAVSHIEAILKKLSDIDENLKKIPEMIARYMEDFPKNHPDLTECFMEACLKNHPDMAERLMEACLKNYPDMAKRLMETCLKNHPDMAKRLMETGLKNHPDMAKRIMEACLKNYPDMAKRIIKKMRHRKPPTKKPELQLKDLAVLYALGELEPDQAFTVEMELIKHPELMDKVREIQLMDDAFSVAFSQPPILTIKDLDGDSATKPFN